MEFVTAFIALITSIISLLAALFAIGWNIVRDRRKIKIDFDFTYHRTTPEGWSGGRMITHLKLEAINSSKYNVFIKKAVYKVDNSIKSIDDIPFPDVIKLEPGQSKDFSSYDILHRCATSDVRKIGFVDGHGKTHWSNVFVWAGFKSQIAEYYKTKKGIAT